MKQTFFPKCIVCMHAGKCEEICMSHSTKDANGKVICPFLLAQKCYSCKATGHTPKYCPLTKSHAKEEKLREYLDKKAVQEVKKRSFMKKKDRVANNYFGGLLDFDEESDEE